MEPRRPRPWTDPAALEGVRAHAGFRSGLDAFARQLIGLHRHRPLLNQLVNDRGRMMITGAALYLHYEPGGAGLSTARLQALCVAQEFCSAGRASATVALLRWGGFLRPAPSGDRRVNRLAPTEALITAHRERWRNSLEATARVFPETQDAADRLDDPGVFAAMVLAQTDVFLDGFRFAEVAPVLRPVLDRNLGFIILLDRLLHEAEPASVSALSRAYRVSRAQAAGVLRDHCDDGRLRPDVRDGVERFAAALFLLNVHCARRALAASGRGEHPVDLGHQLAQVDGL